MKTRTIALTIMLSMTAVFACVCAPRTPPIETEPTKSRFEKRNASRQVTIATNARWLARWRMNWQAQSKIGPPPYTFSIFAVGRDEPSAPYSVESAVAVADAFAALGWSVTIGYNHPPIDEYADWFDRKMWQGVADRIEPILDWCQRNGTVFDWDIEPYSLIGRRYPLTRDLHADLIPLSDALRPLTDAIRESGVTFRVHQASLTHATTFVLRAALGDQFIAADSEIKYMTYDPDVDAIRAANAAAHVRWSAPGIVRNPTVQAFATHRREVLDVALELDPAATVFFSNVEGTPVRENYYRWGLPDWHEPLQDHFEESLQGPE